MSLIRPFAGLRPAPSRAAEIAALRKAYKTLYKSGLTLEQAKEAIAAQASEHPEIGLLSEFLARTRRSIIR